MSNLTFTKIDQGIKDRKRLHLTFLKKRYAYPPFLELEAKIELLLPHENLINVNIII